MIDIESITFLCVCGETHTPTFNPWRKSAKIWLAAEVSSFLEVVEGDESRGKDRKDPSPDPSPQGEGRDAHPDIQPLEKNSFTFFIPGYFLEEYLNNPEGVNFEMDKISNRIPPAYNQ